MSVGAGSVAPRGGWRRRRAEALAASGAAVGPGRLALRRMFRNRLSIAAVAVLGAIVLAVVLGPFVWTADPNAQHLNLAVAGPSSAHPLGTDTNGRDMLARVLAGGRVSISISLAAVLIAAGVGALIGLAAGFAGGLLDAVAMRAMDILLAFPSLLLALAVVAAAGAGVVSITLAVAIPNVAFFARIMRSMVISVRERDYVLAARASGVRRSRILLRHVVPNSLSPVIVAMALVFGLTLLDVAALGFLGFGIQPPQSEWGTLLNDAREYLLTSPVALIVPGLAIALTALAGNLVGDALNDAFDTGR